MKARKSERPSQSRSESRKAADPAANVQKTQSPQEQPPWVPEGESLDSLPPDVQELLAEFLPPHYEELVVKAQDDNWRAIGLDAIRRIWRRFARHYYVGSDGKPTDNGDVFSFEPCLRDGMSEATLGNCLGQFAQRLSGAQAVQTPETPAPSNDRTGPIGKIESC